MGRPSREQRQQRVAAIQPLLTALRADGRSYRWLANRLDMPYSTLTNYFQGERQPPPMLIERACAAIGVSASNLGIDVAHVERPTRRSQQEERSHERISHPVSRKPTQPTQPTQPSKPTQRQHAATRSTPSAEHRSSRRSVSTSGNAGERANPAVASGRG